MKLKNIIIGWWNDLFPNNLKPEIKELFDSRLKICRTNTCKKLVAGICIACGCPVRKKTKVLTETCPENMWEPVVYQKDKINFVVSWEVPTNMWIASLEWGKNNNIKPFQIEPPYANYGWKLEDWQKFLENYEQQAKDSAKKMRGKN